MTLVPAVTSDAAELDAPPAVVARGALPADASVDATVDRDADEADIELPRRRKWLAATLWALILLAALAGYGATLHHYWQPAIVHPDANGYWAQATLLVETGRSWFTPASDAQYVGMHWLLTPGGAYVSRYPPGLPLLTGFAALLARPTGLASR